MKLLLLTKYEYLILQLFVSTPNKIFTKNNIFENVWNDNFIGDDNSINVHIGNLRKKFSNINPNEQDMKSQKKPQNVAFKWLSIISIDYTK
nr:winged helix-turn-helix domain-containing protein [Clostridioides difficile]